jgi:hypothetical protein
MSRTSFCAKQRTQSISFLEGGKSLRMKLDTLLQLEELPRLEDRFGQHAKLERLFRRQHCFASFWPSPLNPNHLIQCYKYIPHIAKVGSDSHGYASNPAVGTPASTLLSTSRTAFVSALPVHHFERQPTSHAVCAGFPCCFSAAYSLTSFSG